MIDVNSQESIKLLAVFLLLPSSQLSFRKQSKCLVLILIAIGIFLSVNNLLES